MRAGDSLIKRPLWGVVPAAGIGVRMEADRPKQYLSLAGKTVIQHSIERLLSLDTLQGVVVAIAAEDTWWSTLAWSDPSRIHVVDGGAERSDSVLNALDWLAEQNGGDPWVLVHDAVRPCLGRRDLEALTSTLQYDSVGGILAAPVADTIKRSSPAGSIVETVDRSTLWRALTPQMFPLQMLRRALWQSRDAGVSVTDDAQAIERLGARPHLVEGSATNFKITRPGELAVAEEILREMEI